MMRSHVPCEFCQATPTQRYWVDTVGPDECPDLYNIFLWVCESHAAGMDIEEDEAPESAKFMTLADIKAAPIGFTALAADERYVVKTVAGWAFSSSDGTPLPGTEFVANQTVILLNLVPFE